MTYTVRLEGDTDTIWLRQAQPSIADPILLADESLTSAQPRVVQQSRPGRSGISDLTVWHDEAAWQAKLTVFDGGGRTRHQHVDRLRAMLRPSQRPWLVVQRDGWWGERWARVRGGSLSAPIDSAAGQRVETSIQLVLPDGVWFYPDQSYDTIRPGSGSVGRAFPVTFPIAFDPNSGGATKIVNVGGGEDGLTSTPLLMRLYGACTEPIITNATTGEVLELDNVTIAAGQYIEIDMDARTVLLNGNPNNAYYSKINFATSSWWELQPGDNLLALGAATSDASCQLDLFWNTRFSI